MHFRTYIIQVFILFLSIQLLADIKPDSLLTQLDNADDTTKIKIYIELYNYYKNQDSEKSLIYISEGFEIAQKINDSKKIANILIMKGQIFERRGSYDKAINNFNKALELFEKIDDKEGIAAVISNIGASYIDKGDYVNALAYALKALNYYKTTNNAYDIARSYLNIGLIHYHQQEYEKSLEYYFMSLQIRDSLGDKEGIALAYNNIGISYYFLNEYDKVLDYFSKSLKIYEELNDLRGQVRPLYNIGEIYVEKGEIDKAILYYIKSLKIDEQIGDTSSFAETYATIGQAYLLKDQPEKALEYQNIALNLMKTTDFKVGMRDIYAALSETYEYKKNYKKSLEYYKRFKESQDFLYNQDKAKAIADVQIKYETEKKDEEIELLNKQNELDAIKLERQSIQILLIGIGLVILLVFVLIYYNLLKRNKFKANLLAENNHEINQQKEELQTALNLISDQKEELLKANKEIVETTKAKEIFLANTTHEIRTPVNIIAGFTNLLSNTDLNKTQKRYIKNISNSANNLLVVINDILTFSKIEAGRLKIEAIDFNLHEVIRNYFESIVITADAKNLNISYTIDNDIPNSLIGDPVRLQQIISNIVGNALKFTDSGGFVDTKIEKLNETENEIIIKYTISDNGIGIDEDKLQRIFESFTQADKTTSRKYGGTGLGLSIVKKLVQLQKGKIEVKSAPGKGSTFTIIIPYTKENELHFKIHEKPIKIDTSKTKNIKILVADDNPVNIELLKDMFFSFDETISIDEADNGQEAINKIRKENYDVLLLDIQMPVMDGFKTAHYIRNKLAEPAKHIPIIAISAFADDAQKIKCLREGMNEYLAKPFEAYQLFSKIGGLINLEKKKDQEHPEIKKTNSLYLENLKFINLDYLVKTYNNEPDKIIKILNLCKKEIPLQIIKIENQIKTNDFKNIQISAHSIKTTLNYLGLKELSKNAIQIEKNAFENTDLKNIPDLFNNIKQNWENAEIEIIQIIDYLKSQKQ